MAYMPYTTNPHLPRVRRDAALLVLRHGWSTRETARHFGFSQSAVVKWVVKARLTGSRPIPTESSRPYHHPRALSGELVSTIIRYRLLHRRCAEVLHYLLVRDGYPVGLASVKRVLARYGMVNHSKWKKWHRYPPRPVPEKPGILVQIDTIHDGPHTDRLYVYALLDVCSRWGYALPRERITTHRSLSFVEHARIDSPFRFRTVQSDHGSEFSKWFTKRLVERGMAHRHSRVRQPNDNGHVERFIRTLQDECLSRIPRSLTSWKREIPEYLYHYNTARPHMALGMKTPVDILKKVIPSY